MKDCWSWQSVVFYFPKGSPLRDAFSKVLIRAREAGLIHKLVDDHMDMVGKVEEAPSFSRSETFRAELSLGHLQGSFMLLSMGLGSSLIVLIYERLRNICKHVLNEN